MCGRFEIFHINGMMTDCETRSKISTAFEAVYGNSYKEHIDRLSRSPTTSTAISRDFYQSAMQVIIGTQAQHGTSG